MATQKQRLAFKEITEKHRPKSLAMLSVGYKKNTAIKPQNLTESKGWLELCNEAGLTDELLNNALTEDIKAKPKNRVAELRLAYEIRGRNKSKEEPNGNKYNQYNFFIDEQIKRVARRILDDATKSEGTLDRLPDSDRTEL
jgi:hypothetical protein